MGGGFSLWEAEKGPRGCGPQLSWGLDPLMGTTVTPPPTLKHAVFNYNTKVCLRVFPRGKVCYRLLHLDCRKLVSRQEM